MGEFVFPSAPPVQQSLGRVHGPWDEGSSHRHDQQLLSCQPDHQTGNLRCGTRAHRLQLGCSRGSFPTASLSRKWRQFSVSLITVCFYKDAEARALAKERQKKDNHNLSRFPRLCVSAAAQALSDSGQWTVDRNLCSLVLI